MRRVGTTVRIAAATTLIGGAVLGSAVPANADSGDGNVKVVNTETVQVYTNSTGKVQSKRVYEQLAMTGDGKVDLSNPVETSGLRNLDGFKGFDVKGHDQIIKTTVDGTKHVRSVSDFKGKLPLKVSVTYYLNGKKVDAGDIVGADGDFEAKYTVTNVTGAEQTVTVPDGKGGNVTKSINVPVPMVGSLTTTAPANFTDVTSKGANMAGDGAGGTTLSFTMTLFPPLGSDTATFGYTAKMRDGVVPDASVSALPVNPLKSPTFATAATSYQGGADTGAQLTSGATQIDGNLLKLRDGAGDLLAGLLKLRDGAQQLNTGLTNDAAPGARKIADGSQQLAGGTGDALDGSKKLTTGLSQISDGLDQLSDTSGLPKAKAGALALKAGVDQIIAGVGSTDKPATLLGGLSSLRGGVKPAPYGLVKAQGGVDQVKNGLDDAVKTGGDLDKLIDNLNSLPGCDPASCKLVVSAIIANINGDGGTRQKLAGASAGLGAVSAGLGGAVDALNTKLIPGVMDAKGGLQKVRAGLVDLSSGLTDAVSGVTQLSNGASDAHDGSADLSDGLSKIDTGAGGLSTGADKLAGGLGDASDGSQRLAKGLGDAAKGGPKLVDGAQQLSTDGTKKLIDAGTGTAQDYGTLYATIAAGAKRADSEDMAFGAPAGAQGLTAYSFEIKGEDGEGNRNLTRGIVGLAILAAGAGAFALRRRVG